MNNFLNPKEKQQGFPSIIDIYKQSIINAENYFDDCIILSARTSNSFNVIENMEFWKFRNLMKSLNKYIEAENKTNPEDSNSLENHKKEFNSNMSSQKNKFKPGNFKGPKFKK